jgi:RNA polymerase sigma-70 factor (ECF subfamily)
MDDHELLAQRFEQDREHLRAVAFRMLGSIGDADDAVQEAWLRLDRSDTSGIENLTGWLTTVVGRVCLDMLRARKSRREDPLDERPGETSFVQSPEDEVVLADSVATALLVVLDSLDPVERLAFVLHDMFAVPFDEIAPIIGRTPVATRQIASRARRRVQGSSPSGVPDLARRREIIDAFLAASRGGDLDALIAMLAPDAVMRADEAAASIGAAAEVAGAREVATIFSGGAKAAFPALFDGQPALAWMHRGEARVVFDFIIENDVIVGIDLVGDLAGRDVVQL